MPFILRSDATVRSSLSKFLQHLSHDERGHFDTEGASIFILQRHFVTRGGNFVQIADKLLVRICTTTATTIREGGATGRVPAQWACHHIVSHEFSSVALHAQASGGVILAGQVVSL